MSSLLTDVVSSELLLAQQQLSTLEIDLLPSQSDVRDAIGSLDPGTLDRDTLMEKTAEQVRRMQARLEKEACFHMCDSAAFIKAMALDDGSDEETASEKITRNQARAFTTENDRDGQPRDHVFFLKDAPGFEHDVIHETVHVCSAPGGVTKIKATYGDWLNEGFTEHFTIEYCKKLDVELAPAYPDEIRFVKKLEKACGIALLHSAYLNNQGMDAILTVLAGRWEEKRAACVQTAGRVPDDAERQKMIPPSNTPDQKSVISDMLKDERSKGAALNWFWRWML